MLRGRTGFWKPLWRTGRYRKSSIVIGVMKPNNQESDLECLRSVRRSSLHQLGAERRKARVVHMSRILIRGRSSMGATMYAKKLRTSYKDAGEELAGFEHEY